MKALKRSRISPEDSFLKGGVAAMGTLKETYMDLIYTGSRKRQDLLIKSGAWGPWKKLKRRRAEKI